MNIDNFLPPDGENDWINGSEHFTRQEVYSLLWTQRAMITNDIKATCKLTPELIEVISKPRTPIF